MKRLMLVAMLAMFSMGTLSACNTIAGAGRDVSAAGSAVTQGANEAKN